MDIQNDIKDVKADAMSDKLIHQYIPNMRILVYNQLGNFNKVTDILPNNKSMVIILYVTNYSDDHISGHYVSISRIDDTIMYFDSYGMPVDFWFKPNKYQTHKHLTRLLDNSTLPVVYNKCQYQKLEGNIATCGRYNVVLYYLLQKGKNLADMYMDLTKLKIKTRLSYDEIVSYLVSKMD